MGNEERRRQSSQYTLWAGLMSIFWKFSVTEEFDVAGVWQVAINKRKTISRAQNIYGTNAS